MKRSSTWTLIVVLLAGVALVTRGWWTHDDEPPPAAAPAAASEPVTALLPQTEPDDFEAALPPVRVAGEEEEHEEEEPKEPSSVSAIELLFVNASGKPVAGVDVAMRPSDSGFPLGPPRTTPGDGRLLFDLAPGSYIWFIESPHVFWPDGRPTGEGALKASKPITLEAGDLKSFRIVLHAGEVRGRLHLPGPLESRAIVKVLDATPDVLSEEAAVRTADGLFVLTGLAAGEKLLSAVAEVEGQHFYFYRANFALEEEQSLDLGVIHPLTGSSSDGVIELRMDGAVLDADEVYGIEPLEAIMHLVSELWEGEDFFMQQIFDVTVGVPFHLHGLPPGEWSIGVTSGFHDGDLWPKPRPGYSLRDEPHASVQVPFAGLHLGFDFDRTLPVTVRVRVPGRSAFDTTVMLVADRGLRFQIDARVTESGGDAVGEARVPAGNYRVVAYRNARLPPTENGEDRLFHVGSVAVTESAGVLDIEMREGTCVRGTFAQDSGAKRPLGMVLAGFAEWQAEMGSLIPVYKAPVRQDGSYCVPGVPPDTELLIYAPGSTEAEGLRTGPTGSVTVYP